MDETKKIGIFDVEGINPNPLTDEIYSDNYKSLAKIWSKYPAYLKADEILQSFANYSITFIVSGTGSGKTVLVPKFALHYTHYQGKVVVTLPKKVVTLSAATFSAVTLDVELGNQIGYLYKGSDKTMMNDNNKIIYMTDGSFIMNMVNDPQLKKYQFIIIDEAHERRVQIDMIMLLLKKLLLSGTRHDLKVIIMSATINVDKYQKYFEGIPSNVIYISGEPNYAIDVKFLDSPTKSYLITGMDIIDKIYKQKERNDILFFITSSNEAFQLCHSIRDKYSFVYCIEAYSDMEKDLRIYVESKDKFLDLGNYTQKLIIATNVAESSITIIGLKVVIDSGYELSASYDPLSMAYVFEKKLISKAQAIQRRGRVGRSTPGICYHLLTQQEFNNLQDFPPPDILKEDLTSNLLKLIILSENQNMDGGYALANELMDPPHEKNIEVAYRSMKLYYLLDYSDNLTDIGIAVNNYSSLPLNRSMFLIYSYIFHCSKEACIIVAMMDVLKGNLSNLFQKNDILCDASCKKASKKFKNKLAHKTGDHMTILSIYQEYDSSKDKSKFIHKYGLRKDILHVTEEHFSHYFSRLVGLFRSLNIEETLRQGKLLPNMKTEDIEIRIMESLKMSHQHQISKEMTAIYPEKKVQAEINRESAVYYYYTKEELKKKTFIYDELRNTNYKWEYNLVTII
jgi:HrpA-like RNA helicase